MGFPMDPTTISGKLEQLKDENLERHVENVERFVRIEETIKRIEEGLKSTLTRLFGNGQPGVIDKYAVRLTKLERMNYGILGGVALIELLHTLRDLGWLVK